MLWSWLWHFLMCNCQSAAGAALAKRARQMTVAIRTPPAGPSGAHGRPESPMTKELRLCRWHLTFSCYSQKHWSQIPFHSGKRPKAEAAAVRHGSVQIYPWHFSEGRGPVRGPQGASGVKRGITTERNKLLSHHKTFQTLLSCNPVMDTSSAPGLFKMFSYNNLIQKHIYKAKVINFN